MKASTPTSTQAIMIRPNSLRSFATACGFLKTPEPMTVPMTMAVAIQGPRVRGNCEEPAGGGVSIRDFLFAACGIALADWCAI